MKIIQFKNGPYAIRKWSFWRMKYLYLDLVDNGFWWSQEDRHFDDCLTNSKTLIERVYNLYKEKGRVI